MVCFSLSSGEKLEEGGKEEVLFILLWNLVVGSLNWRPTWKIGIWFDRVNFSFDNCPILEPRCYFCFQLRSRPWLTSLRLGQLFIILLLLVLSYLIDWIHSFFYKIVIILLYFSFFILKTKCCWYKGENFFVY